MKYRQMSKTELIKKIILADDVCSEARPFFRRAARIEKDLVQRSERNAVLWKFLIVCGIAVPVVFSFFGAMEGRNAATCGLGGFLAVLALFIILYGCNNNRSKRKLLSEASRCRREGKRIMAENAETLEFIPEKYRTPKAIRAMRREAEKGKATGLNDLILAYLREEVTGLSEENEKLRKEAERIKAGTESIRQAEVDFLTAAVMLNYTSPKKKQE